MKNIFLAFLFVIFSCAKAPKTNNMAVENFEIEKYLGKWHEIVRLDHSFERGCEDVFAIYSLAKNGSIKVLNRCMKNGKEKVANGVAKFKGDEKIAHLKVSFFRPFYGNYKVIFLDENYRYALIDGGRYDYFWILARDKKIPNEVLQNLLKKAKGFGFDVSKFIFTKQN